MRCVTSPTDNLGQRHTPRSNDEYTRHDHGDMEAIIEQCRQPALAADQRPHEHTDRCADTSGKQGRTEPSMASNDRQPWDDKRS